MIPVLRIAKRGTYCEAVVPDSTYFKAHPCEIKVGLHKVGRYTYCRMHPIKAAAGRQHERR